MFGLTTLEGYLAATLAIVVGFLGYTMYERHAGAVQCVAAEKKVEASQQKSDSTNAQNAVRTFSQDIEGLDLEPTPHPLWVCSAPSGVSPRPASTRAEPKPTAVLAANPKLPAADSPRDIGGSVQDIAFSGMLCSSDATELWELAVKESSK